MTRTPSDNPGSVGHGDGPSGPTVRQLNAQMTERLLQAPPEPVTEGSYALRVLQSRGRISGRPRRTPVGVTQVGGRWYLVSPDRSRDWVRNLRADPDCLLLAGDRQQAQQALPAAQDEAAAAVATYLSVVRAPWALRAFPVAPGASHSEIVRHLNTLAVFRLYNPSDAAGGGGA